MDGSVMNVVCYKRSLLWTGLLWMGLLWTWSVLSGLLWMVCFERTPLKIKLYNCASLLQQMFWEKHACLFFCKFSLPSSFLKSCMPYSRSGVPETGCALLADDYLISSKCRSNMCLKFLVAARRQREMMVIIANAENVKSAEWQDKDNLDISEIIIPEKSCTCNGMPVYIITEHFSSPWENAWS